MGKEQAINKRYYLLNVETKNYNVMIDEKTFFDQSVKNDKVTYENVRKIATGQVDDYTNSFLLDYIYFKNYYKLIVVDLSNQQGLDADPKAIHQINFTASLDRAGNTRTYFILEDVNELFTRNCKSFVNAIPFGTTSLNVSFLSV